MNQADRRLPLQQVIPILFVYCGVSALGIRFHELFLDEASPAATQRGCNTGSKELSLLGRHDTPQGCCLSAALGAIMVNGALRGAGRSRCEARTRHHENARPRNTVLGRRTTDLERAEVAEATRSAVTGLRLNTDQPADSRRPRGSRRHFAVRGRFSPS